MSKILVVGGAGYVGSAACAWLLDRGHLVWVLDDLSTGRRSLALGHGFVQARAGDRQRVLPLLKKEKFDVVMHFAARSIVSESVEKPLFYQENNVDQTRALIEQMLEAGTRNFVFSSTCAIFGDPRTERISETLPKSPLNPYGKTKLEVEKMLEERARDGLRSIALRYFNAAGAEPLLRVGEWHEPETHLIPRVLKSAELRLPVDIYGTDYSTADGTCIRDYIHVTDLAQAHSAAMERLLAGDQKQGIFEAFNLGSENGYSVREVIGACERVTSAPIRRQEKERRAGDPPRLVADSARAKQVLGFRAERGLDEIISSAWEWQKKNARIGKKAVFLDRDGTINVDPGYLSHPDQMTLLPGVGEALARLKAAGFLLVVVSNQSGVGRGLIQEEVLPEIHKRLQSLLQPFGVAIDHFELCFHHPDKGCDCRKPQPKLIIDGAAALGISVSRSYMVGDKTSDVGAGIRAGCRGTILVQTGEGKSSDATGAVLTAPSLREATDWILNQENAGS